MDVLLILVTTLTFTLSPFEAATDCTESTNLETYGSLNLYGAPRYSSGMPVLIRNRPVSALTDTLIVEDAGGYTYWVKGVDLGGNEACSFGNGVTVGVATVGVPRDDPSEKSGEHWVDLQGRKLKSPPTTAGIYWKVVQGKPAKLVILK